MKLVEQPLVIFFIPPTKFVGGGIMSIFSLCKETRELPSFKNSDVIICVYPGNASYEKNDLFSNNEYIFDFDTVIERYSNPRNIIIHIPENDIAAVHEAMSDYSAYFNSALSIQLNILNQNIKLMPSDFNIAKLYDFTNNITQTTAHDKYASQETANKYGMPVHLFSVYIDPQQYKPVRYHQKENIIAVSTDQHPLREKILEKLSHIKNYQIIEVQGLSFEDYKSLMSRAKFSITFGEGFDGYYIESTFSGGIGFSVYNQDFFPDDMFLNLKNIYVSYEEMLAKINKDIEVFDSIDIYSSINESNYELLAKIYNYEKYKSNIANFYAGKFDFLPDTESIKAFFIRSIKEIGPLYKASLRTINKLNVSHMEDQRKINELEKDLLEKDQAVSQRDIQIDELYRSLSWKITKPLRLLASHLHSK